MAWVEELPSGKFQGRYRNRKGQARSAGTFTQSKQAQKAADKAEDEQRQPGALNLDGGKMTWGTWFTEWHDSRIVSYSTDETYNSTARNHVLPYWRDTPLCEIEPLDVAKWVKKLHTNGASPYTVRNAVGLLKTSLNAARKEKLIGNNPVDGVDMPDMPDAVERFLTYDEVEAITFHMTGINALISWTAVQTGLRFGELAGLHWDRVDLDRGVIQVVEKYDQKADRIDPVPKDKEKRTVPLPPSLVRRLVRHRAATVATLDDTCGLVHTAGRCRSDLVFRGARGAVLKSAAWGVGPWRAALEHAGIEGRVRVHDMRHTYASWLIQDGVSLADIARVMGHSDTEVSRRYAHLGDEGYDKVRNALAGIDDRHGPTETSAVAGVAEAVEHAAESTSDDVGQRGPRRAERRAEVPYTGLRLVTPDDTPHAG